MSQALGAAIGAIVVAEAVGVTNFSGGGSGDVTVETPTKGSNSPIPSPGNGLDLAAVQKIVESSGPSTDEIAKIVEGASPSADEIAAAVDQDDGPSDALLAALAMSGSDSAQAVKRADDGADGLRKWVDEKKEQANSITDHGPNSIGRGSNYQTGHGTPDTSGGRAGRATGEFVWYSSVGPLAQAIDENVPGFGGNAEENLANIKKQVVDDPISEVKNTRNEVHAAKSRTSMKAAKKADSVTDSITNRIKETVSRSGPKAAGERSSRSSRSASSVPDVLKDDDPLSHLKDRVSGVYENDGRFGL